MGSDGGRLSWGGFFLIAGADACATRDARATKGAIFRGDFAGQSPAQTTVITRMFVFGMETIRLTGESMETEFGTSPAVLQGGRGRPPYDLGFLGHRFNSKGPAPAAGGIQAAGAGLRLMGGDRTIQLSVVSGQWSVVSSPRCCHTAAPWRK